MQALPHESTGRFRLFWVTIAVASVQPTILVLFLLSSLVFTGGQIARGTRPIFGALTAFPVVPLPGWILILPGALTLVLVSGYCLGSQLLDTRLVAGLLGPVLGSTAASLFFLLADTVEDDVGFQIALWVNLIAVIPLVLTIIRFGPEYDRRLRSGRLPEGYG